MKNFKTNQIARLFAISGLTASLIGCGSANPAATGITIPVANPYGVNGVNMTAGACAPLSSIIGFSATGITNTGIMSYGGTIPGDGTYGQVVVNGGGTGPYVVPNSIDPQIFYNNSQPVTGKVEMNIFAAPTTTTPTTTPTSPYSSPYSAGTSNFNATGTINLTSSAQLIQSYMTMSGYNYYGYNSMPAPQAAPTMPCINGVAWKFRLQGTQIFGGSFMLTVGNSGATGVTSTSPIIISF